MRTSSCRQYVPLTRHTRRHITELLATWHRVTELLQMLSSVSFQPSTRKFAVRFCCNFTRVCLSVCHCQTISFESLDIKSSYLHVRYISREYASGSYMSVIGSNSRSWSEKGRKFISQQCKTSIGNNTGFVTHRVMKFAF